MADPSLEICPDFAGNLYAGIHQDLMAATGATDQDITAHLINTWTDSHEERTYQWNQRCKEEAQALAKIKQVYAVQEEEELVLREAEAEKEQHNAEKKKPKMNGFNEATSVGDAIAPHPSQFSIQKLNNFEYIELWYFSPDSCKEALKTSHSITEDTLSLMRLDDQLSIHPASTFLRVKNMFLAHASKAKWPQTHLNTLSVFFWHLKNHVICDNSEVGDLVVLHYASHVRQDWHNRLK